MRLVVADTSPLFYLLSIGQIDLLLLLFGKVFLPDAVHQELLHPTAPPIVRDWVAGLPSWAEVKPVEMIDERKGTNVALDKGFEVTGTLGVLTLAARRGLVDLPDSFARLKRTNFRYREEMMDALLDQQKGK